MNLRMKDLLRDVMTCGAAGLGVQILGKTSAQRDYDYVAMITDTRAMDILYLFENVLGEFVRNCMQVASLSQKTTEILANALGRQVLYNTISPDVDQHGKQTENAPILIKWHQESGSAAR